VQIPDVRTGDDVIDAAVVDEEAVGNVGCGGRGAKILYGKGALDRYLTEQKKDSEVCIICNALFFSLLLSNYFLIMLLFLHRPWKHQPQIMKQTQNFLPLLPACNMLQILLFVIFVHIVDAIVE